MVLYTAKELVKVEEKTKAFIVDIFKTIRPDATNVFVDADHYPQSHFSVYFNLDAKETSNRRDFLNIKEFCDFVKGTLKDHHIAVELQVNCYNCLFFDTKRVDTVPGRGWCVANSQWVKEFESCRKFKEVAL